MRLFLAVLVVLALFGACGEDDLEFPGSAPDATNTPASTGTPTQTQTPTATPTP
ncbi:MAG: hypothetical protein ACREQ9_26930 [Candidatus Binatia bacterium]